MKYKFFTGDPQLRAGMIKLFSEAQLEVKNVEDFPGHFVKGELLVVDGDVIPVETVLQELNPLKRKKIPVVLIVSRMEGWEVMEAINRGIVSVLFKDYTARRIKQELKRILNNFNYLEKAKEIAENENRNRKFLAVVNSLTSDNDINKITHDILASMIDVFKLESTVFFIIKKNRLERKIVLGKIYKDYPSPGWELTDKGVAWLQKIQEKREALYITKSSRKDYGEDFPNNTLLLPLVVKERFFGLIATMFRPGARELNDGEVALLKAFAEQTAVALENAKLYWDVIKAREELVKQEKKALLNQTIISLNHEINNPLSIISMEAQLLQQRLEKKQDVENKIEERLGKIEFNIDRIKQILDRITSLSVNTDDLDLTEYVGDKMMLNLYENKKANLVI